MPSVALAQAFFRAGYIESWGRGIEKINSACLVHGIDPPIYDTDLSGLMLTFRSNPIQLTDAKGEGIGEKSGDSDRLTENQQKILALLREDGHLSARELTEKIGISNRNVEQNIARLKSLGHLQRVGSAKHGYWKVITPSSP